MGYTKGFCPCGNLQESKGRIKGRQYFGRYCTTCRKSRARFNFIMKHESKCFKCGFIAEHRCQLDVDHIDGNHLNNDESNFQILCANCHRLKTYINKDYMSTKVEV